MMEVVTGGSGSGKSAYAEQKICGLQQGTGRLYYIATMYPYGSETAVSYTHLRAHET